VQTTSYSLGLIVLATLLAGFGSAFRASANEGKLSPTSIKVDTSQDLGAWEGWGSSLAWWARAIGGSANADYYADLIYTDKIIDGYPALGLNIVRYNVGGGGIDQTKENKGRNSNGRWTFTVIGLIQATAIQRTGTGQ